MRITITDKDKEPISLIKIVENTWYIGQFEHNECLFIQPCRLEDDTNESMVWMISTDGTTFSSLIDKRQHQNIKIQKLRTPIKFAN
jgi:hypothetical protein